MVKILTAKTLFFLTLGLLSLALYCYYWKIQLMYNSSVLSLYTPDTFYVPENLRSSHNQKIVSGTKYAKQKRVIIAALVRDVAERLPEIKVKAERMGRLFKDYRILIVENDSSDGTREKLLKWAAVNPKVTILGCGYNVDKCSVPNAPKTEGHHVDRTRIEKMVKLRNIYLDEIKKNYRNYDYSIFWDLDMVSSVYLDGVMNTMGWFSENPSIDAICAYGFYRWGHLTLFYDTFALQHKNEPFHIDMKTVHDVRKGLWEAKYDLGEDLVEVDSCFSGFTIYQISSLLPDNVVYDMSGPNNLECEHSRLHMKLKGKKMLNPSMMNFVLENS